MAKQGPPTGESVTVPEDLKPGQTYKRQLAHHEWLKYWDGIESGVEKAPERRTVIPLSAQGGAILTTPIPVQTMPAGLYRVSFYARITRAATTNSSLTVTFGWIDGGVACTASGAALTGNTTATTQFGTLILRVDANSSITYETVYASVGGTSMQYKLDVVLELLASGV